MARLLGSGVVISPGRGENLCAGIFVKGFSGTSHVQGWCTIKAKAIESNPRFLEQATDDALARIVCGGDDSAFERLFERHRGRVARIAGNYFNRPERVEEIVQEAFAKAYFALGDYQPQEGASFAAWLSRITHNTCYDELRRLRRRPEDTMSEFAEEEITLLESRPLFGGGRSDAESRAISSDLANKLLARLKAEDRMVLTMMEVEEMSVAEIAAAFDWSVSRVKVRAHRARAALRRVLGEFM